MFMDKTLTKLVAKALNVPTVEYIRVNEADYAKRGKFLLKNIESRLKYPVVVSPRTSALRSGFRWRRRRKARRPPWKRRFSWTTG